jgi:hypothetical protein
MKKKMKKKKTPQRANDAVLALPQHTRSPFESMA